MAETTAPSQFAQAVNSNIKAEIARRDIKPTALAIVVGISLDPIRRRLRGEIAWTLDEIEKIATRLGVPPSKLTHIQE